MSNTPSKAEIEALVKRHGATSYRNRADTQHPAYGFTEDGLNGLIDEVLAKWGTLRAEKIVIPTDTMEQEFQKHYRRGYEAGKKATAPQPTQPQAGVVFEVVNEAYSTRACSSCGSVEGPKGSNDLGIRRWTCSCGAEHDRDVNAAKNIARFGLESLAVGDPA